MEINQHQKSILQDSLLKIDLFNSINNNPSIIVDHFEEIIDTLVALADNIPGATETMKFSTQDIKDIQVHFAEYRSLPPETNQLLLLYLKEGLFYLEHVNQVIDFPLTQE